MMETKVNEEVNTLKWLLLKTHEDALVKNEEQAARWKLYRDDHESLSSRLLSFRDELTHPIMVPIGKKALMKGTLIHTNEILVCLGDNWFAKQSAKEAAELCQRRIKGSEEMLDKLNKERQLLETRMSFPIENDTFGHKEAQEIIEPYDEESEKKWRERHRQKERDYHQKLAELKKQKKIQIETEDDLWKRLDALDLQEDLEDELHRLDEEYEDESESSEIDNDEIQNTVEVKKQQNSKTFDNESDTGGDGSEEDTSDEEMQHTVQVMKQPNRVSFDNESDLSDIDNEPVRIVFQHSADTKEVSTCLDLTPAIIYTKFSKCFIRTPKSILKKTTTLSLEEGTNKIDYLEQKTVQDLIEDEDKRSQENSKEDISELITPAFGDVVERTQPSTEVSRNTRPVSKFKASRQAAKTPQMLN